MTNTRRTLIAGAVVVGVIVMVVAAMAFQPWKAFVDDVVDESFPAPDMTAPVLPGPGLSPADQGGVTPGVPVEPAVPAEPVLVSAGSFNNLDKSAVGTASVYVLADGQRVLRLDDFETSNGPDLFVYLSSAPADGSGNFEQSFVNLGRLKGNIGSQNYEIPGDVDLANYPTVVIWCERFTSAFGAAGLSAP